MKKYEIVKKSVDFNEIINKGYYRKNKYYSVYSVKNDLDYPKFGFAVSKKIGNAVERNKIKRQLRNIVDNNKKIFANSLNYIIMVRRGIKDISYKQMEENLVNLMLRKDLK